MMAFLTQHAMLPLRQGEGFGGSNSAALHLPILSTPLPLWDAAQQLACTVPAILPSSQRKIDEAKVSKHRPLAALLCIPFCC